MPKITAGSLLKAYNPFLNILFWLYCHYLIVQQSRQTCREKARKMGGNKGPLLKSNWDCCLKTLGHGDLPKVTLYIVDCGWPCSLDITMWTGVWESMHNLPTRNSSFVFYQGVENPTTSFIIEHSILIKVYVLHMWDTAVKTTLDINCFSGTSTISNPFLPSGLSSSLPSHLCLRDLPSTRKGTSNLQWCGGTFLHSDRGSAAHTEVRDYRRGSALHSCHHTSQESNVSDT